jgi:hypothetical protein
VHKAQQVRKVYKVTSVQQVRLAHKDLLVSLDQQETPVQLVQQAHSLQSLVQQVRKAQQVQQAHKVFKV